MATHRVLVTMEQAPGSFWYRGQTVDYDGPSNWKLEPLDEVARAEWEETTAQPDRVDSERQRHNISGVFEEADEVLPPGALPVSTVSYPPSGWSATNV